MMNFFVNLVNDVGVHLMLIGTLRGRSLFRDAMRYAKHATGDSLKEFKRPVFDGSVVGAPRGIVAWDLQWTREKVALTQEIRDIALRFEPGGTDLLIKLLVLSQRRAVGVKREHVTIAELPPSLHKRTGAPKLPQFAALRKGTRKCADPRYEDLLPLEAEDSAEHIAAMEPCLLARLQRI